MPRISSSRRSKISWWPCHLPHWAAINCCCYRTSGVYALLQCSSIFFRVFCQCRQHCECRTRPPAAAAARYWHGCPQYINLADGPFEMSTLPVSGSTLQLGPFAGVTNNMRTFGFVANSRIEARFSIGQCYFFGTRNRISRTTWQCNLNDVLREVDLIWGAFDFAGFCAA